MIKHRPVTCRRRPIFEVEKVVLATVLMIVFQGEETITIHDDENSARATLIRFVDERWEGACENFPNSLGGADRVRKFFVGEHDSYLIAEADLSDLEGALEQSLREHLRRPPF